MARKEGHPCRLDRCAHLVFPRTQTLRQIWDSLNWSIPIRKHHRPDVGWASGMELRLHVHEQRHVRHSIRAVAGDIPCQGSGDGQRARCGRESGLRRYGEWWSNGRVVDRMGVFFAHTTRRTWTQLTMLTSPAGADHCAVCGPLDADSYIRFGSAVRGGRFHCAVAAF